MIKNHILYTDFLDWKFSMKKAQGSFIWGKNDRKLIDFTSGWNVTNLGWNHPEITQAIINQARKNTFVAMWLNDEIQAQFAKEFVAVLPKDLDVLIRTTGGTESNEKALFLARNITKRKKIIGFKDTYHGQSYGTISIGYRREYVVNESPVVPEFIQLQFPTTTASGNNKKDQEILDEFLKQLESLLKKEDIAAIVTEAGIITGWGSTAVAPKGYLTAVRKLTKKYGTLLILDEVGTGFSRCGKLFGMHIENVSPDIATFAKGLTNGAAPMGAVAIKSNFGEKLLSGAKTHSTFGWMSIACAAALKTLQIHKRDNVWETAKKSGAYLLETLLKNLNHYSKVGNINGIGMEIGLTFVTDRKTNKPDDSFANKVVAYTLTKGLHLSFGGDGNIQIMPPLTIDRTTLDKGLDILIESIKKASK